VDSIIDFMHAPDWSIEEHHDKFVVRGFSHKERVDLVEVFSSNDNGFEV